MEEIDVLRVEHANDVTTIHELRTCLDDEKRGNCGLHVSKFSSASIWAPYFSCADYFLSTI